MRPLALTLTLLALAGCATHNTLAQDFAYERWYQCAGKYPTLRLKEVRTDGQIWWHSGDVSPGDVHGLNECLREAARTQAQTRVVPAPQAAVVVPPPPVASPSTPSAASSTPVAQSVFPANVPAWRPGFEWAYRWEGPDGWSWRLSCSS